MNASSPHSQGRGTSSQYSAATSTSATSSPKTVETTMYWRVARAKEVSASTSWGRWVAAASSRCGRVLPSMMRKNSNTRMKPRSETTPATPISTCCRTPTRLLRSNLLTAALTCSWVTPSSPSRPVAWSTRSVNWDW